MESNRQTDRVGKTAFFIGSPFQCLCALEAINVFNVSNYDFYIYDTIPGSDMLKRLLEKKGILFQPIVRKKHLLYYLLFLFKKHPRYESVFIGNMFDNVSYAISSLYVCNYPSLFYMDDGIQALAYFGGQNMINPLKKTGVAKVFESIYKLKGIKRKALFTIYDVSTKHIEVIHNGLSLFKFNSTNPLKGVYIVGTNSSALVYKGRNYFDYLNSLFLFIQEHFHEEEIFYCPHRRDSNNIRIKGLCIERGIHYYNTNVSIEYDFVENGVNPLCVIGFASNALFVLKAIFPNSVINTVHYDLDNEDADRVAKVLENKLNENGISSINIY